MSNLSNIEKLLGLSADKADGVKPLVRKLSVKHYNTLSNYGEFAIIKIVVVFWETLYSLDSKPVEFEGFKKVEGGKA